MSGEIPAAEPAVKILDRFPSGVVTVPPSKSLSHRAVICAALAGGEAAGAVVRNLGRSEDIAATERGIAAICAAAAGGAGEINCGESGSTLRFLIPLAAGGGALRAWRFTGRGRLLARPQDVYADVFLAHGGEGACFVQEPGAILVRGPLLPGRYELRGDVSSQFLTGLLLALPLLSGDSEIALTTPLESAAYVDLTLDVMRAFGVTVCAGGAGVCGRQDAAPTVRDEGGYGCWHVPGGQRYRPAAYTVEGDWSQAAFFLCAAALGRDVKVEGLRADSLQGDRRVADVLKQMRFDREGESGGEPASSPASEAAPLVVDCKDIPDIVPPLAAAACCAVGETRFENAGRLRLKESDRLAALAQELARIGADAREEGDALVIRGRDALEGGAADAHGDHRIAMALAVASIRCRTPVRLTGAESVAKSYPDFWRDWEKS